MIRSITAAAAIAAVLALTACSSDPGPAKSTPVMPPGSAVQGQPVSSTARKTPGVYQPLDTGKSQSGLEASIISVEDANTAYGSATVITFQIVNTTDQVWAGFNWSTPDLVYGAAGTVAVNFSSSADHLGDGVAGSIPPGSRQTVREAYHVHKAQLSPAVITAGSVVWAGDFSTFQR